MQVLSRISVLGSVFLAVLAAGPSVVEQISHLTAFRGFAGTSVLILVGSATDTARKVQAEIISQKYKNIEFYDVKSSDQWLILLIILLNMYFNVTSYKWLLYLLVAFHFTYLCPFLLLCISLRSLLEDHGYFCWVIWRDLLTLEKGSFFLVEWSTCH